MDIPPVVGQDNRSGSKHNIHDVLHVDNKIKLKKKLIMMEAAMPAVLAWNMFQICQSEDISPAAAARKIFQMDLTDGRDYEEPSDEKYVAILQKLDNLIHYHRKLRFEFVKVEELSKFRESQIKKRILELEMKTVRNRRIFDELVADLNSKNVDSGNNSSVESLSSHDLVAFEEMQRLAENEILLKKKIDELEKKERIYLKTLEQADELWTALKSRSG